MRLFLALLASRVLSAEGLEVMHAENANSTYGRWRVQLQGRLRTHRGGGQFYQNRFGPTFSYQLGNGVSLSAGTHVTWQRDRSNRWDYYQRVLVGIEHPLIEVSRNQLQNRLMYEAFIGRRAYSPGRWRDRVRFSRTRDGIAPFLSAEFLASAGRAAGWYAVGLRWPLPYGSFETAYELRRTGPATSHVISTVVNWNRRLRKE
ncbi:MAG: DUF2490 domain-containing protein [Bryobacteraceae bacterium]